MAIEDEAVGKKEIFAAIVASAAEYYKTVVGIATAFLGGTLLFIEKLSPAGAKPHATVLLFLGWVLLIFSILCVTLVQRWNLESGKRVMRGKIEAAEKLDERTARFSSAAIVCLTAGIFFITIYGYVNLIHFGDKSMSENTKASGPESKKTIPFGSTQPVSQSPATSTDTGNPQQGGSQPKKPATSNKKK